MITTSQYEKLIEKDKLFYFKIEINKSNKLLYYYFLKKE